MPGNALIENNRRNWDERVAIHRADRTGFYAIERFLAGDKSLHAIETGELGDISGKRLLHLQCHFGLDTLILARHGADTTGLDFSPAAIAEAQRLAAETGLAAEFVCAELYDGREAVAGEFDVVFTTWGTICWLPDMPRWARVIASLLAPGGFLYFADAHPNMLVLEERDGRLVHEYAIDTPPDRPLVFNEPQSYSGDPTPLTARRTYEWIHSLSRVLGALLDAGLTLEFLHEHPVLPWRPFPMCVPAAGGMYRLPDHIPSFPLSYSLQARKVKS
ncbi:MAG TPA: class I SAM-dependent methyltransferase [Stellaceae bacterium]|jgi:SAM-dependent methyltransferase|nr:class I SAM-dependent methyltransferase [Stellaceae bacterium]